MAGQVENGYFDHFGLEDGLSQSTVHCIYQDSYGFLWIGTEDGLNRFDGYRFEVYQYDPADSTTIPDNVVRCIYEDDQGVLWIGTGAGLSRYNRFSNIFNTYSYRSDNPKSISDNTVTAIAPAGDNHLWIGTRNGLNLMDKAAGTFQVFKNQGTRDAFSISNNRINDLVVDYKNRMWCATGAGLNLFDPSDSTFLTFDHLFDVAASIPHPVVNCLDIDRHGNIWAGTNAGLCRISPLLEVQRVLQPVVPEFAGFSEQVLSLEYTADQLLWVGTPDGLLCINDSVKIVQEFVAGRNERDNIGGGSVLSLLEDFNGAIWIGTNSGGIFRYSEQQQIFTHYAANAGGEIWCATQTAEDSWLIGGRSGLHTLHTKDNQLKPVEWPDEIKSQRLPSSVKGIVKWKDNYFVGFSGDGLIQYDEDWKRVNHYVVTADNDSSISNNRISCLLKDEDGIWVGTVGGGINFFNPESQTFRRWQYDGHRNGALLDNHVTALLKDHKGNLWIGTANRGVTKFNPQTDHFTHYEHQPGDTTGISVGQVSCMMMDRHNHLWIGTRGGGVNILDPATQSFSVLRSLNGLPSNTISGIVESSSGAVWVSTNSGVARIDPERGDVRRFGAADGLRQLEFVPGSAGILDNGYLWFGSSEGMVVLDSKAYVRQVYSPKVVFTEVNITAPKEGVLQETSFFPPQNQPLTYAYGINTISIQFAQLSLMQSEKNTYAYRIENMTEHWTDLGHQRDITLFTPEPGTYQIQVIGSNHDGIRSIEPAELTLVIHPVLWQTSGFKFLIIILLSGGIYLLYRWRIMNIKAQNRMLESVVRDRTQEIVKERDEKAVLLKEIHHRVKNNMQIIMSLLSLQSRFANDQKTEHLFLESINRLQSMSMIHEKMYRSENLKEVDLDKYLNELVSALVEAYNLGREIETDVVVDVDRFAVDTLTPLGLIVNELVSNALKYAFKDRDEGKLTIKLYPGVESNFHLLIADNGIGYSEKDVRDGAFGTELVDDLAEQLQGKIERLPTEKGTTFLLTFMDIDHR